MDNLRRARTCLGIFRKLLVDCKSIHLQRKSDGYLLLNFEELKRLLDYAFPPNLTFLEDRRLEAGVVCVAAVIHIGEFSGKTFNLFPETIPDTLRMTFLREAVTYIFNSFGHDGRKMKTLLRKMHIAE